MSAPNIRLRKISGSRREFLGVILVGAAIGIFAWWVSHDPQLPNELSRPLYAAAGLVFVGGILLYNRAAEAPSLIQEERVVDSFHPSVIISQLMMAFSLLPLGVALYLYRDTTYPYIYVFVPLSFGIYVLSKGLIRYWKNTLTTNYLTTHRIMSDVRFFGVVSRKAPLKKPNTVNPRSPWYCRLFGLETIIFDMPGRNIRFVDAPSDRNISDTFEAVKEAERDRKRDEENERLAESLRDVLEQPDEKEHSTEEDNSDSKYTKPSKKTDNDASSSEPTQKGTEEVEQNAKKNTNKQKESDVYNDDGSIPLDDGSESEEHNSDTQSDKNVEHAIERLDEVTYAWVGDGGDNQYLRELVEKQAKQLEKLSVDVIFPEIGSEVDLSKHHVIQTEASDEPKGTILSVVRVGLQGDDVKSRDVDVITSSGNSNK
jgi:hypothetical protein